MSTLGRRIAELGLVGHGEPERLAGGDLSEVLLLKRPNGLAVAKGAALPGVEASMLRALAAAGMPVPRVEAEYEGLLLLDHVENDGVFSPRAWASIGNHLTRLHAVHGADYGWPVDYQLGTVALDNRPARDWPRFFGDQRLRATAALLDRPWRERVDVLANRLPDLLPAAPPASLLHGDLWTGNILVRDGALAALIDPAANHGHAEVDIAMLTLFAEPPPEFWSAYGQPEPGWGTRRHIYQLFPALVHLRLFGATYAGMVDRLFEALDA